MRSSVLLLFVCLASCGRPAAPVEPAPVAAGWSAIAPDLGDDCADVGDVRACWVTAGPRAVERTLPRLTAPRRGWRCTGRGLARGCRDRATRTGPFECDGDLCRQRHPYLPDDGEWECIDQSGAVICLGAPAAAGVMPAAPQPGWRCAPRSGHPADRVCVDLSPDLPTGDGAWRCHFEHDPTERRVCERGRTEPSLGDRCPAGGRCPEGARCVDGHCLPDRVIAPPRCPEENGCADAGARGTLSPACWVDTDCDAGSRCRWGRCSR